ncbi:cor protein [Enterobacter sp. ENT03]|uniref:phage exclusion lipoprotein Cor n=1 Tax=Enterobacter sp. ENT03 TaxID=2854780 RepID=UPI001C490805|nr:cor protein [Enterobacter sp. ENT03]MBV7404552.1 cor protein [Enterobacter sp. ENT03]
MFKKIIIAIPFLLSACAGSLPSQKPICQSTAITGGQEYSVNIYGVRKQNGQTLLKAGYPFNWQWVNLSNFTNTNCK